MTSRVWAAAGGVVLGLGVALALVGHLETSPSWQTLRTAEPQTAQYMRGMLAIQAPFSCALWALGLMTLGEVHGWIARDRPTAQTLPVFPFDPGKTQLILGEMHEQDGSRSGRPGWMVLPEGGMTTGILVTGATGAAKTSSAQYPFTAQLIRLHAKDPKRKFGGLIIDAKGNYADFVREQCRAAGRIKDYYEVSVAAGTRYNIIGRPDLSPPALGSHIADMIRNVQGESFSDPFWHQEAKDLATQCIRLSRLSYGREPTMYDLYRLATSYERFNRVIDTLRVEAKRGDRKFSDAENAELESLAFWCDAKLSKLDPKLRASIAAGINGVASLFDNPSLRAVFCPAPHEENFLGFDDLIARGQIVALRVPYSELKQVSQVVGTMTKLNFFDAVMNRLSRRDENGASPVSQRMVFFVADEYDQILTQPADGSFYARCREAGACCVLATQSFESLVAKLKNEHLTGQLLANLRTKIWLCCEDNFTAQQASRLCGEIEREKVTRSRNESVRQSAFSLVDGRILSADAGSVGEAMSVSHHRELLFPSRAFTTLKLDQAIVKMHDGREVHEPWYVYLKPIYGDPNVSWFDSVR